MTTHPVTFLETDDQKLKALQRDVRRQGDCIRLLIQALVQDGALSEGMAAMIRTTCPHVAR